jgi:23S rRNA (guanine1835-N2)-methyltransferase
MTGSLAHEGRELVLRRHPARPDGPLRAWDAADEYLLQAAGEVDRSGRLLVINDSFGALSIALAGRNPAVWSDSHVARLALQANLAANNLASETVLFVPADTEPGGAFDLVLARIPKSLAFWEDLLLRLRPHLRSGSRVIAGGMIKHTPARAYRLFEEIIGPVRTSLGWKKARLAFAEVATDRTLPVRLDDVGYDLEGFGITLKSGPNVHARERLDLGTRALLPHLPAGDATMRIADLGCGNGALSLVLAIRNPRAAVLGVDESYQAVASARLNAQLAGLPPGRDLVFEVGDGLAAVEPAALDLVVCNPPFHQDHTITDRTAWVMFRDARRALRSSGRLLVVGNRHLGHPRRLARLFSRVDVLKDDGRFVVAEAIV